MLLLYVQIMESMNSRYCIVPRVLGHFLDTPGSHPRGAIFPTVH